jgi:hypothetical protein
MIKYHRQAFFLIIAALIFNKTFAQSKNTAIQENKFVKIYSQLSSFRQANYDSLKFYSDKFGREFTSFIKNNPGTLSYPFNKLTENNTCYIRTSSDGNFKIYSWDTWTGGSMHMFQYIYQWKANGRVFTKASNAEEDDSGFFCSKIFTVNIREKPYYLAVTNGIFSSKDVMQSISSYTIEGNRLNDTIEVFKMKTKKLNTISVEFDFFSVVDRPERPLELIMYDEKRKIIYIPVVNERGQVTKKNILYQLKDRYFEFISIERGTRK